MAQVIVTREGVQAMILNANKQKRMAIVGRALNVLFDRQTASEQAMESTTQENGIGFTQADGGIGASMAKFYNNRGYLTEKQVNYWLRPNVNGVMRIAKYHKQLNEAAIQKQRAA